MTFLRQFLQASAITVSVVAATVSLAAEPNKKTAKASSDVMAQLAALRAEVAGLKDRENIREVYVDYGRGIDRLDEQMYRRAFWSDARIGYGTSEAITPDEHWNVHMMKWHKEGLKAWGHFMGNESIDVDGDVAHVEIYVVTMPMAKNEGPGIFWGGRYVDRLDRRNGEWRIAAREFVPFFAMKTDKNYKWLDNYTSKDPACTGDAWSWQGQRDVRYVRPLPARTNKEAGTPCAK